MFPITKYKFFTTADSKTIAVSTYAGKTIRGVAKLDPRDNYDPDFGRKLAAARCEEKVTKKRMKRSMTKLQEAVENKMKAEERLNQMILYNQEAILAHKEAKDYIDSLRG